MPVTELALLHLTSNPPNLSDILPKLKYAATKQATFSSFPVTLLRCVEDPADIYLIGGWESVAQHMEVWIPGETNQELMAELKGDVDVRWMFHVSVKPEEVSGVVESAGEPGHENEVVAVGRYFVTDQNGFEEAYQAGVDALQAQAKGGNSGIASDWRVDAGFEADGQEENGNEAAGKARDWKNDFVLFTAWNSAQEHFDFARTKGFKKWAAIKDFVSGAEIRHGKVLLVAEPYFSG